ncbi:hypothetical protein BDV32DRAFT_125172 [Aspergillus pseudonomiae]|uniref:Uncharacterized protein n=1 Tax=Aspergillus pseudonomiae TaxID=1506151 RepID=A0A5N7DAQ6_9EURO|nr:uncharacterized protein BDV37DRAFT_250583 [Aspergillus pseudonomiae]KAB8258741.1 hypothetical protein BDV32DRAFT_125172 [Aspergillus pseudonomiae]KAE8403427.1 hypothetical protein BDV37DRAFT_250583 [Aspergillus pseudonomiae]
MAWSPETIIALVTLLVASPSTLLLIWKYIRRRKIRCTIDQLERAGPSSVPPTSNDLILSRFAFGHPEILLETGLYRDGAVIQIYTYVPPQSLTTQPWPSYCYHGQRSGNPPSSAGRPMWEWE